jgi:nicotinamide-nucleotide amidase
MMLLGEVLTAATSAAARLRERGESVAVAESSTGGLIAAALVAQDGASHYFRGGFVFYTLESMTTQLADASDIEFGERSATEQRARWVADSARARLGADWGVGETGATGPSPNHYGDPAGHSWVAASGPDGIVSAHVLTGDSNRLANMEAFAVQALGLIAPA